MGSSASYRRLKVYNPLAAPGCLIRGRPLRRTFAYCVARLTAQDFRNPQMAQASTMIDLKHLLKLEKYHGEVEKFQELKGQLYVTIRVLNPVMLERLEWIEKHLSDSYALHRLSEEEKKIANEVYTILALTCAGSATEYVRAAEVNNGFEAWAQLCKARTLRSSVARLHAVLDPMCASTDPRVNIRAWQRELLDYECRTGGEDKRDDKEEYRHEQARARKYEATSSSESEQAMYQ